MRIFLTTFRQGGTMRNTTSRRMSFRYQQACVIHGQKDKRLLRSSRPFPLVRHRAITRRVSRRISSPTPCASNRDLGVCQMGRHPHTLGHADSESSPNGAQNRGRAGRQRKHPQGNSSSRFIVPKRIADSHASVDYTSVSLC